MLFLGDMMEEGVLEVGRGGGASHFRGSCYLGFLVICCGCRHSAKRVMARLHPKYSLRGLVGGGDEVALGSVDSSCLLEGLIGTGLLFLGRALNPLELLAIIHY